MGEINIPKVPDDANLGSTYSNLPHSFVYSTPNHSIYITKDSGERQEFSTGMVRDTSTAKARYDLIWKPGLKRVAELMGRGALKYGARNWEKAATQEELERFKESANRHFEQWFAGDIDEDHMAAVIFNLFGAEYTKTKLQHDLRQG